MTAALTRHRIKSAAISVATVSDAVIKKIHAQYLGNRSATDVITFDLSESRDGSKRARHVEGEIVISLQTARRVAKVHGHAPGAELALYAVHGVLHLLGYEDLAPRDAAEMHATEDEILVEIGEGPVFAALPHRGAPRRRRS